MTFLRVAMLSPLFALAAVGCAPTPILLSEPPPSTAATGLDGRAEIFVVRDSWAAFAISFGVYINDEHVGELSTYDYIRHRVPPGPVEMFVGTEARSEASFPVEADRTYLFRVEPSAGWWVARPQLYVDDPANLAEMIDGCEDRTFATPQPFPFELEATKAAADGGS